MRVEFHDVAPFGGDVAAAAASLVRAVCARGDRMLVLVDGPEQAAALDADLWNLGDDVFLPHAVADDEHASRAPVVIGRPGDPVDARPCVLNLRPEPVTPACALVLELIPIDEAGRQSARQRWRAYQAAGVTPVKAG